MDLRLTVRPGLHLAGGAHAVPDARVLRRTQRRRHVDRRDARGHDVPDPDRAHLVPYNTTSTERDLALRLGIPLYGADPKHFWIGTKSGARRIFAEEGVSHPLGVEDLRSPEAMADAIIGMRRKRPGLTRAVAKLNEGVLTITINKREETKPRKVKVG